MLYLHHYGLQQLPFQETANPEFLWLGKKQLQTITTLKRRIAGNKGLTLLSGEVGTGKTVILNSLAGSLDPQVFVARINNPDLDIHDFLNSLSDSFAPGASFRDKVSFLSRVISAGHDKKMILLIIDEAHHLLKSQLEELSLLLQINKNGERMVNILLAGQQEHCEHLNEGSLADITQVNPLICTLQPLTEEEIRHYIEHRLKTAGANRNLFTAGAMNIIHRLSEGIPRVINNIGDNALLTGYSRGLELVDSDLVLEIAHDVYSLGQKKIFKNNVAPMMMPPPLPLQQESGSQFRQAK